MKTGMKWYYLTVFGQMPTEHRAEQCVFKYTELVRATSPEEAIQLTGALDNPTYTVVGVDVKVAQASGARRLRKYQVYTKYFYYKVEAPSPEDAILFAGLDGTKVTKVEEVEEFTTDIIAKQFWL